MRDTLLYIIPWSKSINEYLQQEDPDGVVKLERLSNNTNKEAYTIIHNWDLLQDPNHRPFYQKTSIIKGMDKLVIVGNGYGANPMGCQWSDEYMSDVRLKTWNIIDSISLN